MSRNRALPLLVLLWINAAVTSRAGYALPVEKRAASHEHWEHIAKRSAEDARLDENYKDDTSHIVNVQDYYRQVFEEGWEDYRDHEQELFGLLHKLKSSVEQGTQLTPSERIRIQEATSTLKSYQKRIKGRYIVMFDPETDDYVLDRTVEILQKANRDSNQRLRATDITKLRHIGKGFTGTLNSKTVQLMQRHPLVTVVEEDIALKRSDLTTQDVPAHESEHQRVEWNLDRIDQHNNHLDGMYLPEGDGANVNVYIIDTGIRYSHHEFGGRAHYAGFDAIDHLTGSNQHGADCHGHGTHCAGTSAGSTYGVAKQATIYSARALDCSGAGAVSGIVLMMDFITQRQRTNATGRPAVLSQSLGVHSSESLNSAIQSVTEAGLLVVGAAGNQGGDACNYSPASARVAVSVGATDNSDRVAHFSNVGTCTDLFAPGVAITSSTSTCDTCTRTLSGTSMACPHATGYAAILRGLFPNRSPHEIKNTMIHQSTKNVVNLNSFSSHLASRTPNRLLYVPQPTARDADIDISDLHATASSNPR